MSVAEAFNETARLAALRAMSVLGTPPEPQFDRITRLAAHIFKTPIALMTFVDENRQWFKSRLGIERQETPREHAFCAHAILKDEVLIIPDATQDRRFSDNPLVTREPNIRFYAGAPLVTPQGFRLGTLCVIDRAPRNPLTEAEQGMLRDLAAIVMDELELRRLHVHRNSVLSDQIVTLEDAAQAAHRAKREFMAMVSHELRTPLNAIIGIGEVLSGQILGPLGNETYAEYSDTIVKSGQHLLSLVENILEFKTAESGEISLEEEEFETSELIKNSIRLLKERARQSNILLHSETGDDTRIIADRNQLIQVLANLIDNAIKFTPGGGRVVVRSEVTRSGELLIQVEDTGIGMATDEILSALEAFRQIDGSLTRKHEGIGLGLPLSHRLIRLHGGELILTSTPNKGTTAEIRLPSTRVIGRPATQRRAQLVG